MLAISQSRNHPWCAYHPLSASTPRHFQPSTVPDTLCFPQFHPQPLTLSFSCSIRRSNPLSFPFLPANLLPFSFIHQPPNHPDEGGCALLAPESSRPWPSWGWLTEPRVSGLVPEGGAGWQGNGGALGWRVRRGVYSS